MHRAGELRKEPTPVPFGKKTVGIFTRGQIERGKFPKTARHWELHP
jgi:hypothetical protein